MFRDRNETLTRPVEVARILENAERLLPIRLPAQLPAEDDRFNLSKKERVFVCDVCGLVVPFSSAQDHTDYKRAECEFAGSFVTQEGADFPAWLRSPAWEAWLIDATWHCSHRCHAPTTLNEEQKKATGSH